MRSGLVALTGLCLAGCLRVPEFGGDRDGGPGDGGSDGATTGHATLTARSHDGYADPLGNATVYVGAGGIYAKTMTGSDGTVTLNVVANSEVYVVDPTPVVGPQIVAILGVQPGDDLHVGAPQTTSHAAPVEAEANVLPVPDTVTMSSYTPARHSDDQVVGTLGSYLCDERCAAFGTQAPLLFWYVTDSDALAGGQSGIVDDHTGIPSAVMDEPGSAADAYFNWVAPDGPSVSGLSGHLWATGSGARLASTSYTGATEKPNDILMVPFRTDPIEATALLTTQSTPFGMFLRVRSTSILDGGPPAMLDASAESVPPWLATVTNTTSSTVEWTTLSESGTGIDPTLIVVDRAATGAQVRWIVPPTFVQALPSPHFDLPLPSELAAAYPLANVTPTVRLVLVSGVHYDDVRPIADQASYLDDFFALPGVTRVVVSGERADPDGI